MAATSRRITPRRVLLLLALVGIVAISAPVVVATGRPAERVETGDGDGQPYAPQHFGHDQGRLAPWWFRDRRFLPPFHAHADLTVGHYTLVASQHVSHGVWEFKYRARLTNSGPKGGLAALNATARLTGALPQTEIVEGQLTFGDVAAGTSAQSLDTFTIRRHHPSPLDLRFLRWMVSTDRELAVPISWAGAWHITLTYRDPVTKAVTAIDETDGVIRDDEPFGLAFSGPLATCTGRMTDRALTLACELRPLPNAPCHVKGTFDLTLSRIADSVTGTGAWQATGSDCKPAVSVGQTVAVSGIRLGNDPGPAPPVATTLLRRFVSQPLFVLFATSN